MPSQLPNEYGRRPAIQLRQKLMTVLQRIAEALGQAGRKHRPPPRGKLPLIAPATGGSAADASSPRRPPPRVGCAPADFSNCAEPCAPAAEQMRGAGAGNARDAPAARPFSGAGLRSRHRSGPGRPSGGCQRPGEQRGPSDVPATAAARRPGRRRGKRCRWQRGSGPGSPDPSSRSSPENHALPKFKSPPVLRLREQHPAPRRSLRPNRPHRGSVRRPPPPRRSSRALRPVPARSRPAPVQGTPPRNRPARAVPGRDPRHGETPPRPARRRDAPMLGEDATTDGAAGALSPRCPGTRPRRRRSPHAAAPAPPFPPLPERGHPAPTAAPSLPPYLFQR
ncbi:serine/arginine repetitive matrix protein 1-like [Caloenas nicobarica]|uniref:serine/arginine repetitive matrix protein 1-like n=1 Tax=Caloenas nicobarica TaxID=187106 RepID=UPI0032B814FE